ncbi:MAG: sigma-54 interaction domain-containing protein [Bacillus sp. (in: firmicutes)]
MLQIKKVTPELWEALFEVIDEGIHAVNTEGRTILYNKVAARNDGMDAEEVIGRHLLQTFPSLTKRTSTLLQVLEHGKPIFDKSQTYVNEHGYTIDTVNTTFPVRMSGKLIGAVEVSKDVSRLRQLSERLMDLEKRVRNKEAAGKNKRDAPYCFDDILTEDPHFKKVIDQGQLASRSSSSVLVYGESGTGKELFVQGIHNASSRRKEPFIAQNCAALPETLLESLLFGTAKGSYTGAVDRPGLFESAHGGTLFLDEIQSMSESLQAKLLRVLEDGMVKRIGSNKSFQVDVRVIGATNIDPDMAVSRGVIRLDLFYRLNVLQFRLPPLRERRGDIPLLTAHFMDIFKAIPSVHVTGLSKELEQRLFWHPWKGNVRELKHCMEYMMNVADSQILDVAHLPEGFSVKKHQRADVIPPLREALLEREKEIISLALERSGGNVKKAAGMLEIPRQTLQYKLKKMGNSDMKHCSP